MPIYEYTCADCGRLSSVFLKSMNAEAKLACTHCGGKKLSRALSRFAYHKSEQRVLEEYGRVVSPKAVSRVQSLRFQVYQWEKKLLQPLS